ncbi:MAG: hypothetical protein RLZZ299_1437 [Pseudomonadota bacterium]|jgi:hypothetical protein
MTALVRGRPAAPPMFDHEREPAYHLAQQLLTFASRQRWPSEFGAYLRTNGLKAANRVVSDVAEGVGKRGRNSILTARGELAELCAAFDTAGFAGWRPMAAELVCALDALLHRYDEARADGAPYTPPKQLTCGVAVEQSRPVPRGASRDSRRRPARRTAHPRLRRNGDAEEG